MGKHVRELRRPTAQPDDDNPMSSVEDDEDEVGLPPVPALVEGTVLAGRYAGSGYLEPPRLVYRPDGQVVKLPSLLYLVVQVLDRMRRDGRDYGDRDRVLAHIAAAVSRGTDRGFTAEHVAFLIDRKLAPLGVASYTDGSLPDVPRSNPFLSLRFRMAVLPASATWFVGGLFSWLFHPAALVPALAAVVASEFWMFGTQSIGAAFQQTLLQPASILLVVALAVGSAAFHEVGHGTACRYSGVRPGVTGAGVYIVWPAFYTDITNSYRLNRRGRLRADLGGVYFNGLFVIMLTAAYLATGFTPLLVAVLSTNLEILQQLLPTLRFDGYYIIADLVGVPDLFRYLGPILKRTFLRRPDAQLAALKRWPQVVVAVWVLGVIPVLLIELGIIVVQLPSLSRTDWHSIEALAANATASGDPILSVLSAVVQILLLLVPVVGVVIIVAMMIRSAVTAVVVLLKRRVAARAAGSGEKDSSGNANVDNVHPGSGTAGSGSDSIRTDRDAGADVEPADDVRAAEPARHRRAGEPATLPLTAVRW